MESSSLSVIGQLSYQQFIRLETCLQHAADTIYYNNTLARRMTRRAYSKVQITPGLAQLAVPSFILGYRCHCIWGVISNIATAARCLELGPLPTPPPPPTPPPGPTVEFPQVLARSHNFHNLHSGVGGGGGGNGRKEMSHPPPPHFLAYIWIVEQLSQNHCLRLHQKLSGARKCPKIS